MASVAVGSFGADLGTNPGGGGTGPGPGSGSGGGMEAELGALLGSVDAGGDESATPDQGTSDSGQPPIGDTVDQSDSSQVPAEGADLAADPNAPPANAEPFPGWKLNEDGTYTVTSTELPRIQAALQYNDAVSQIFQTPQEAQESYAYSSGFRQLQNDWKYGTPDAVKS